MVTAARSNFRRTSAESPTAAIAVSAMTPNWIGSQIDDSSVRSVSRIVVTMATRASWKSVASMSLPNSTIAGLRDSQRTAQTPTLPSFRGAPKARTRNPEKQGFPLLLDSGSAAPRRPGMTAESFSTVC